MLKTIGSIINYLVAIGLLAFGIIYLFKSSFMPYHSQAISTEWSGIEQNTQFLILALMKTVSGGFIASAVVIAYLQFKFHSSKLPWIPSLIFITGFIFYGASIYAQIMLRINTPGNPPTAISFFAVIMLLAGYIFNQLSIKEN